jgi:hypothetical protein
MRCKARQRCGMDQGDISLIERGSEQFPRLARLCASPTPPRRRPPRRSSLVAATRGGAKLLRGEIGVRGRDLGDSGGVGALADHRVDRIPLLGRERGKCSDRPSAGERGYIASGGAITLDGLAKVPAVLPDAVAQSVSATVRCSGPLSRRSSQRHARPRRSA